MSEASPKLPQHAVKAALAVLAPLLTTLTVAGTVALAGAVAVEAVRLAQAHLRIAELQPLDVQQRVATVAAAGHLVGRTGFADVVCRARTAVHGDVHA
jgi:hypothetical protein